MKLRFASRVHRPSFPLMSRLRFLPLLALPALLGGCINVNLRVEPVDVHVTADINLKVDRALDDFFGDLDKKSATINAPAK